MSKQHFYIDTHGNDDEAYREAMKFACELAEQDPAIIQVILLVPGRANSNWLDRLYGAAIVNVNYGLRKG